MALSLRYLKLLAIGILLFGAPSLHAQAPATPDKEILSFTVYAPNESPVWSQLFFLQGEKPPVKLAFSFDARSVPIQLTGAPKPLVFGMERIDPLTQKKIYVPVAEVAWPESTNKALVIFATSGGAAPVVQAAAFDDSLKVFPLQSVRFFNATGHPLLGKVAKFEGSVPPGVSAAYPYTVRSKSLTQIDGFPFALAAQDAQGGAKLLYDGTGSAWPMARTLVVIAPPKLGAATIELRMLVDAPPAPKS